MEFTVEEAPRALPRGNDAFAPLRKAADLRGASKELEGAGRSRRRSRS
jgi:hypothetical protein